MKRILYTLITILLSSGIFAQDIVDALRYSNYHIKGTARSSAMGNAFGALGGDFTSLSINPAGAGVYRSGEFTFTPTFGQTSVEGSYLNNSVTDSKYTFGFDNIGYIATFPSGESSEMGLVSFSVGLGFNKLNNYSMNMLAEGHNANHSLLTYFTDYVNNPLIGSDEFSPYYEGLAWNTYLINYDEANGEYYNDLTDSGYGQSQRKSANRRGYINEYVLSLAANFNHKVYVGATIGIHDVYFKETANLFEYDQNGNIPYFNEFNFNSYLKTTGGGFNIKAGVIFKPTDELRLGFAVHSPTFYSLTDTYTNDMTSSITYDDGVTENYSDSPNRKGLYEYEVETPMKMILSGAYVIGKSALISVDYELVDYSTINMRNGSDGYDFYDENRDIEYAYKAVGNIHIGGEFRVNNNISLRAGYENFPSVYNDTYRGLDNLNKSSTYSTASAGIGFKQGGFFMDMAYKRIMSKEYLAPYPGAINMAKYDLDSGNIIFTLGFKF